MYHEDWILRQIESLVRMVSRIVFHKDKPEYRIRDKSLYSETDLVYKEILELLKDLRINEAENLLFYSIENSNLDYLRIALDFYDRLNKFNDEDLEKGQFTRKEIKEGLEEVLGIYKIKIPGFE